MRECILLGSFYIWFCLYSDRLRFDHLNSSNMLKRCQIIIANHAKLHKKIKMQKVLSPKL